MLLDRIDRKKVADVTAALRAGAGGGRLDSEIMPAVSALLGFERAGYFGLKRTEAGACIDFFHGFGHPRSRAAEDLERLMRGPSWTYDFFRPARKQRNRAVSFQAGELEHVFGAFPGFAAVVSRHPWFFAEHQLRTLVCDGSTLLAWVGGYRGGSKSFTFRERALLEELTGPLRERLVLERDLGSGRLAFAALPPALEEIPAPAFIVSAGGRVVHANSAGRALLDAGRADAMELRGALAQVGHARFRWTPLQGQGVAPHHLVIEQAARPAHDVRAAFWARRWGLTPRQAEVLALLSLGRANKTIAAELRCAEPTVEFHVTALLGKAGCESRAELVARFWTGE